MSTLPSTFADLSTSTDDTCVAPGYFNQIQIFLAKRTSTPLYHGTETEKSPPTSAPISAPGSVTSGSESMDSFEIVDTEEGREIKDEGGAGSVNVLEKISEKL